jgi:hypothetical protein
VVFQLPLFFVGAYCLYYGQFDLSACIYEHTDQKPLIIELDIKRVYRKPSFVVLSSQPTPDLHSTHYPHSPPPYLLRLSMHNPHPLPATYHLPSSPSARFHDLSTRVRPGELCAVLVVTVGDDGRHGDEVGEDGRRSREEGKGEEEGVVADTPSESLRWRWKSRIESDALC